ncbi:MAG: DUF4437 domain-containing protein [Rhodospirillaceae bacterium]|nr:DUF4437 domain-containing protein [Rhodospirillaceae bacterium]
MARPHIDFIQAQALPWVTGLNPSFPDLPVKTLCVDPDSGASTVIVRFPPGWRGPPASYLPFDQELYVLDGGFTAQGARFGLDAYAYWPAGFAQYDQFTDTGADVLCFIEGAADIILGRPPPGRYDQTHAVPHLDTHDMAWTKQGLDPDYEWFGFSWKVLRHIPATQATTFLLDTPAQRHPPGWMVRDEVHDCTEEIMILSGELCCPYGILTAGAYLNRPPGIRHGPYYTRFGNVLLGRVDGKLENNFNETAERVTLTPPHLPRLPENLCKYANAYQLARY